MTKRILCLFLFLILLGVVFLGMSITAPRVILTPHASAVAYEPPTDWSTPGDGVADKLWVRDFPKFVNENSGHPWLLAQSPEPCLSVDEATRKALDQAASQLASIVRLPLKVPTSHHWEPNIIISESRQTLILKHLEGSGLIRDRFVQKFKRPYGDVWRASLLIDASPKKLNELNNAIVAETTETKTDLRNTIFSTLGLLAVICGVYYLMDAITRGYFKTRLRVIAVLLAIIGVFILLFTHVG